MSLMEVKKCLKKLKEDESSLAWVDEEVTNLLYAIAEHLLVMGKEHEEGEFDPEEQGMVLLKDFCAQEKIFTPNMVHGYLSRYPDFAHSCSFRSNNRIYIYPNKTREYLKNMPRFKKLLERFGHT